MKFCVVYCKDRQDRNKVFVIKKTCDGSYLMYDLGIFYYPCRLNKKLSSKRIKYGLRHMNLSDAIDFNIDRDFSAARGEDYYKYYLENVRVRYIVDLKI